MSDPLEQPSPPPPPRAFVQGTGLVFQIVGGTLFLLSMFVCCGSSLLNKDFAMREDLGEIAWRGYSAQRAISISLMAAVFFGLAAAGTGLGMQADYRSSPLMAVAVTAMASLFWLFHLFFAAYVARSWLFSVIALALAGIFAALLMLGVTAARQMRESPPPARHDIIPPGTKIPYSHYHDDPPEVRLAAELEQRRQRLEVQRKELEALEEKMRMKLNGGTGDERR